MMAANDSEVVVTMQQLSRAEIEKLETILLRKLDAALAAKAGLSEVSRWSERWLIVKREVDRRRAA